MNTLPTPRRHSTCFIHLLGAAAVVAGAATCSWGRPCTVAAAARSTMEDPTPPTWDVYLLFILRLLYEFYGGDEGLDADLPPEVAMQVISDQYAEHGTPTMTAAEKAETMFIIEKCYGYILDGPYAEDPDFQAFLATLRDMYADLGGDPDALH